MRGIALFFSAFAAGARQLGAGSSEQLAVKEGKGNAAVLNESFFLRPEIKIFYKGFV